MNELENAILLLEQMETCLRYGQIPTFEMLERLSDSGSFGGCTYLNQCFGRVKSGWQFPQAWRKSVQEERSGLGKRDKAILSNVADILGGSDFESQIEALSLNRSLLKQNLSEAIGERNTRGKLYRSLGILLGIGIAIFMI